MNYCTKLWFEFRKLRGDTAKLVHLAKGTFDYVTRLLPLLVEWVGLGGIASVPGHQLNVAILKRLPWSLSVKTFVGNCFLNVRNTRRRSIKHRFYLRRLVGFAWDHIHGNRCVRVRRRRHNLAEKTATTPAQPLLQPSPPFFG